MKRTRIRPRSKKRQAANVVRQAMKADIYAAQDGRCARCKVSEIQDYHERLRRSAGGSITDPANVIGLCRACHSDVTLHSRQAIKDGWAVSRFSGR